MDLRLVQREAIDGALDAEFLREALRDGAAAALVASGCEERGFGGEKASSALAWTSALLRQRLVREFISRRAAWKPQVCAAETENDETQLDEAADVKVQVRLLDVEDPPLLTKIAEACLRDGEWTQLELACPRCRRPADLRIRADAAPVAEPIAAPQEAEVRRDVAFCAAMPDGSNLAFLQALVLGRSLARLGERASRVLYHGASLCEPLLDALGLFWTLRPFPWPQPRLWAKPHKCVEKALKFFGLGLTSHSKIVFLDLGLIFRYGRAEEVLEVFELDCPAAGFAGSGPRSGRQRCGPARPQMPSRDLETLQSSLVLLEPSDAVFGRIFRELSGDTPFYPPRGHWSCASAFEEYLWRLYGTFFCGSWSALPAPFTAGRSDPGGGSGEDGRVRVVRLPVSAWSEALEIVEAGSKNVAAAQTAGAALVLDELAALGGKLISPWADLIGLLGVVGKHRCTACQVHDLAGSRDPVSMLWHCRFCWEELLLQDSSAKDAILVPHSEKACAELRETLGDWYQDSRQQRWAWKSGGSRESWIELRPKGVAWTRDYGVAFWEVGHDKYGKRLIVNLCVGDRPETMFELAPHKPGTKESAYSSHVCLYEVWREVFRMTGFVRRTVDWTVQCWTLEPVEAIEQEASSASFVDEGGEN